MLNSVQGNPRLTRLIGRNRKPISLKRQTMNLFRSISIFVFVLFVSLAADSSQQAIAQDGSGTRVAVIDMQEVLNDYYKTKIEIEKLNALVDRREERIRETAKIWKAKIDELKELRKKMDDSALSKEAKEKVAIDFKALANDAATKEKELAYFRKKASVEIATARAEMEKILLVEIKAEMKDVIEANGIDLVFDKSFLPKANKSIMYTSAQVIDLGDKVVASLNSKAP